MLPVIVSNTGPLISLEKLGDGFTFIAKLYRKILIPEKVAEEVSEHFATFQEYQLQHQVDELIQVFPVSEVLNVSGIGRLDAGEAEAISLASDRQTNLLIEEIRGRAIARSAGVEVSGIAGQIGFAACNGIINVAEASDKLQTLLKAGRINHEVLNQILQVIKHQ